MRLFFELLLGRNVNMFLKNLIKPFLIIRIDLKKVLKQYSGIDEVNDDTSFLFSSVFVGDIQDKLGQQVKKNYNLIGPPCKPMI